MNNASVKEHPPVSELRNFGLILASGFIVFFGLLIPLLKGRGIHLMSWPWLLAAMLALFSLAAPQLLGPLHRGWMFLGHILGWINTRIILGIVFLVIFTPVAFIIRLMGKDAMQRSFDVQLKSYRLDSKQPKSQNLHRPY